MAGQFQSRQGDLEQLFVTDYAMIDQYAATGSLWNWGHNNRGGLGTLVSSPIQTVAGGTNWKQVAAGLFYTAAIKTDGTLWLWGWNAYGNLGDNTNVVKSSPVQTVSSGTNWKQVSANGSYHIAAIKTDGTLWTWGYSYYGQLGNGVAKVDQSSPVQTVSGGTNWKSVSTGSNFTAAIKTDGTLWGWGQGGWGAQGDNTFNVHKSSPVQTVSGGTNWKSVSGGGVHTAAIKTDGTLWTFGHNGYGQLGTNSTAHRSSPVQTVSGGTNWKSVAAGSGHTAAIKTDGTLWTWGYNSNGQLGDGSSIVHRSSPIQTVAGGTNWKQLSTGSSNSTTAIKTDGTLWTWGGNPYGGLGDNTITHRSSPVQTVSGGTNWKQVAISNVNTAAIFFYEAGNLYPNS